MIKRTNLPVWDMACDSCKESGKTWIADHEEQIQAVIDAYEGQATHVVVQPGWCDPGWIVFGSRINFIIKADGVSYDKSVTDQTYYYTEDGFKLHYDQKLGFIKNLN